MSALKISYHSSKCRSFIEKVNHITAILSIRA
nr:MAG TPA: hypothetical protein [Caudoviricetes sp.]